MFGSIGGFEILVLLAIGLLVFGPRRLPEVGRWVARGLGELRKAAADVKSAVEKETDLSEVTRAATDIQKAVNTEARKLFTDLEEEASVPPPAVERIAPGEQRPETPAGEAGKGTPPDVAGRAGDEAGGARPPEGSSAEAAPEPPAEKPSPAEAPEGNETGGRPGAPEQPEGTRHR